MADDILIQYPNNTAEMLVQGQTPIKTLDRYIGGRLKLITVSIPDNGIMVVYNNNVPVLFFSGESGTLEFENGLPFQDAVIELTNTGTEPARFNYRCLFVV